MLSIILQVVEFIFCESFNNEVRLVEICNMFALLNSHILKSLSPVSTSNLFAALEMFNKIELLNAVRQIIEPKSPPVCISDYNEKYSIFSFFLIESLSFFYHVTLIFDYFDCVGYHYLPIRTITRFRT